MVYAVPRWEVEAGGNIFRWSNWRALRNPTLFSSGREKKFRLWCLCADYNTHYTKYNWENTTEQSLKTDWQRREQETCVLKTNFILFYFIFRTLEVELYSLCLVSLLNALYFERNSDFRSCVLKTKKKPLINLCKMLFLWKKTQFSGKFWNKKKKKKNQDPMSWSGFFCIFSPHSQAAICFWVWI